MTRAPQPDDLLGAAADPHGTGAWQLPLITPGEESRQLQMRRRVRQSLLRHPPPAACPMPVAVAVPPLTREEANRQLRMHSTVLRWKSRQLRAKSDRLFARAWTCHRRVAAFLQAQHGRGEAVSSFPGCRAPTIQTTN
jgi:hypothetical protein